MKSSQSNHSVGPRSGNTSSLLNSSRKLNALARTHRFMVRRSANLKLTPKRFIDALVASALSGHHSLRQLAFEIGLLLDSNKRNENDEGPATYSKQALWERLNANAVTFVRAVVGKVLQQSIASIVPLDLAALPGVRRILVGDSSTFRFHPSLYGHFPGGSNQHGIQCAQNRFQLTFDLLGGKWLHAQSDPYNRNDRSAARDIVENLIEKGDLIIRDLGFGVLPVFAAIAEKEAFFLSRLNTVVALYDENGQRFELLNLARSKAQRVGDSLSITVLIGAKQKLRCRLVLRNEGEKIGNIRRRNLSKLAKRQGMKHSKKHRALQNWTMMVTNLEEGVASNEQICELYRLRWQIENIFKIAKSETKLKQMIEHRSNPHHIEVLMWGWVLAMIHLGMRGVFAIAVIESSGNSRTEVKAVEHSIFKSMQRLLQLAALAIELKSAGTMDELVRRYQIQHDYHDHYEKRRKRLSLPQRMSRILDSTTQNLCLP